MAAWKKKEKELSPEEAIAEAKKALEPYWFWSEPLLAAIQTDNRVTAVPLDSSFSKQKWLAVFLDPMDFGGENGFVYLAEWIRRFKEYDLRFMVVLTMPYKELRNYASVRKVLEAWKIQSPTVLDFDGMIGRAFEIHALPTVLLLQNGHSVFGRTGSEWAAGTELEIHQFLRMTDPGLPLRPAFKVSAGLRETVARVDFGLSAGDANRFPYPSVQAQVQADGSRMVDFLKDIPRELAVADHQIGGRWQVESERAVTRDSEAYIKLRSKGDSLSLIAMSLSKTTDLPRVLIEVDGGPVYDSILGEHATMAEDGQGMLVLKEMHLYHVLDHLPTKTRDITLRFPNAATEPLAIYGVRFGRRL